MSKTHHRIVIGDVHGHYDGLMRLQVARLRRSSLFSRDLIDRGPQSAQVVDFVQSSSYHCLLGNHEQMLLEVLDSSEVSSKVEQTWLYSGYATVTSYEATIPQST